MKLTQIGIIVGAIIGFNAAQADPLPAPYPAPEPAIGVKEGTTDLGIKGKVAAIEPLAMDNTAVWQMGSGDMANVTINQNTSGVTDGHVALVDTHASYKSDVVVEQSGNLNEAHVKLRYKRNNALIDQDGLRNQARVKVQGAGRNNDLRVTQMGDDNISVVKAKGGADRNEADVNINGNSNTTYTEFSNGSVDRNDVAIDIWGDGNYVETIVNTDVGGGDRNDVDIDLMNSNDNRVFTLQTGSHSNATVSLTNSNMNQFMIEQTSYDNAAVLGNGANGNVGLIYQN
ncbi:curlin [Vibrio sp. 10N.222.51.E8]|uniref:curlin n=1 Tax=unclassified Vibrio TaxID=2614977 RepID=UPI0010BD9E06|nr:curlin [Vibrio sp. F13]TKG27118.1 curlin [Vibrio sp. F13]